MASAPAPAPEINQLREILTWIGFTDNANRTNIIRGAFETYSDIQSLNEKDITEMSESYSKRTAAAGKIDFGIRRTKRLKFMVHWVHDFYRVSTIPSTVGLNKAGFLAAIAIAGQKADVRKQLKDQSSEKAKVASPGPLISESKWTEWEPKFSNYLSTLIGMNGIPLSYVIRENDAPDRTGPHTSFTEECIACAPLTGVAYESDCSSVHQSLVSFTTGKPSEHWIKSMQRFKDGRRSMIALRNHFSGEGNATRRIAEADRIKETLHYRNERALTFETFLTKCEKMYNIYAQHGEEMSEDAKIRFLFKKIQHSALSSAIEAMKSKITTDTPGSVTYTTVANHISTAVSELPDYVAKNRNISGLQSDSVPNSIYNADGKINTGHHPNWLKYSDAERKKVNDERARLGLGKKRRAAKKGGANATTTNQIDQLKKANAQHKRTIASLKKDTSQEISTEPPDVEDDAGNSFGGKATKKTKS